MRKNEKNKDSRLSQIIAKISFIFEYLCAIALAVVFALYANAITGWFVTIALILLPFFSFLYLKLSGRFLQCEVLPFPEIVGKGDTLKMSVIVKNQSFLPTFAIKLEFENDEVMIADLKEAIVYLMPKSEQLIEITYTANHWGDAVAGIKSAKLIGMFSFFTQKIAGFEFIKDVNVIPNIAALASDSPVIRAIRELSSQGEESEDTKESDNSFGGMPGNEHREYVEGDSLKRINWKLSARLDKYMVRKSDETCSSGINVFLDPAASYADMLCKERAVEGFLGVLMLICRLGLDCKAYVNFKNVWQEFVIERDENVNALREKLAEYKFSNVKITASDIASAGNCILVTPCIDNNLDAVLSELLRSLTPCVTIACKTMVNTGRIWLLDENYDLAFLSEVTR